jgi:Protein of unknown function (DUF2971)
LRVYKFLGAKWGLEALEKKRIKISRFHELNDPFDCHAIRFDLASEREAWQRAIFGLGQNRALTCFSMHFSNPLLWSHYAENHSGIALGFDVDKSVSFLKVSYSTTFLDGRGFLNFSEEKKLLTVKRALSRKSLQWKYESEVRAFVDLDHDSPENGHYFLDFSGHFKLSEVIVGPRCASELSAVENASVALNAKLKTAWLSSTKYEVVCA